MLRCAIVEDSPRELEHLKECLARYSAERDIPLETTAFGDAASFLEHYRADYDIVFMDIELPGINGMEAAHRLREKAHQAAGALGFACKEGVYAIFPGPCYETAAEIRAYEHLGADAIGMSTVPEVIAANYLGMAVLGIACITNMATGIAKEKHSHQEVLRIANESSQKLCALVERVVREL